MCVCYIVSTSWTLSLHLNPVPMLWTPYLYDDLHDNRVATKGWAIVLSVSFTYTSKLWNSLPSHVFLLTVTTCTFFKRQSFPASS